MQSANNVLMATLNNSFASIIAFIPRFLSGLIILLLGIIIASFLKQVLRELFKFIKLAIGKTK